MVKLYPYIEVNDCPDRKYWKDNTEPSTDYIWIKLDDAGNKLGVFQWQNGEWRRIAPSEDIMNPFYDPNIIYGTDENGEQIALDYSMDKIPYTIVQRTPTGTIRAEDPSEDIEVVTLKMLKWRD